MLTLEQNTQAAGLQIVGCTLTLMLINIDHLKTKLTAYKDEPGVEMAMEISAKIDELQAHVDGLLRKLAEVEA